MSEEYEKCALCYEVKKLSFSHIIPNSFIKKVRRKSPQLIAVRTDDKIPKYENVSLKEKLLCHECEQLFSSSFEAYGLSLLRRSKNIVKAHKNIIVYNYDHSRFYLYCLSIFWRMSQSRLDEFKDVILPVEISNIIRSCLLNRTLLINSKLKINEVIKIDITKVYDPSSEKRSYLINNVLCPCYVRHNDREFKVSFFAEGLFYTLRIDLDPDKFEKNKNEGLSQGSALRIKRIDYRLIEDLYSSINLILNKARQYPII